MLSFHLEQQKDRLLELLETTKDFEQRLRVEKIILDIEGKITNLVIKIAGFDYVSFEYDPGPEFDEEISLVVKNLVLTDEVIIKANPVSDKKTELTITSKPRQSFIFLDFGRNYRNILTVLMATKSK